MITLVLTVIGRDRPGLVERVADAVVRSGGTWERSSMARLGSTFAGIVEVRVAVERRDELRDALAEIGDDVLTIRVEDAGDMAGPTAGSTVVLELVGQDRPGIVHEISEVLARFGVGIGRLDTATSSAPMSAEPLFEAWASLDVPPEVDRTELAVALESIAQELMVDIELADTVD